MTSAELGLKTRTARQIIDASGNPYQCFATENIWLGYGEQFSSPTGGNVVTPLTSGKAYFKALLNALQNAQKEIYIAGWEVNWDAMLEAGGASAPKRLFDVLLDVAKNKPACQIYIMPWDDTAPIQTYDDETKLVLESINDIVNRECVKVRLANAAADKDNVFFTHHQKQVIIDRATAFIGGMDLAYGRYDDERYLLKADTDGRAVLNRYNGCVVPMGRVDPHSVVNPAMLRWGSMTKTDVEQAILRGAWEVPLDAYRISGYGTPAYETLDANTQPRMPWQDVHLMLQGPAVAELTRNFVFRWNAITLSSGNAALTQKNHLPIPPAPENKQGGCHVQVLRSAPATLRLQEFRALSVDDKKQNRFPPPSGPQNDIARAMEILIDKAQHFIYIENQFFVSEFGAQNTPEDLSGPALATYKSEKWGIKATRIFDDADEPPENDICNLLAGRIGRAILDPTKPNFHVYITLPVHPEGRLDNGSIMSQVHWTMQSLVFGSMSLLSRIRRFIKARELYDQKDADWGRVLHDDNNDYKNVPMEKCFQYVTLLNLRNWEKIGEHFVTEQIYVHSKLMIVDDRFALVGSANINDRSLLGSRDSELAVLIMDTDAERTDFCGDGKLRPTRGCARELRKAVWKKIFGITGGNRPAKVLQEAIDKPAHPKSWKKIQEVAEANTKLYEAAFDWIPRNKDPNDTNKDYKKKRASSIWPRWTIDPKTGEGVKTGPMPFDKEFWTKPQHNAAAANLTQVKGYITLLPIDWTKAENNNLGYHNALLTEKKQSDPLTRPTEIGRASTDEGQA